ncbi:hypothetical protein A2115_03165 [Candidatus Woesebacteria bacterium GWA1_41_8]|jgi:hypothetical protein|uniref:Uncharacterized protein n=1 Tax=Candidatus Woesebacteria bacterium GWA1_41_8 TaxID=1802471 RepID=A0A1F7WHL7_9BACT|nr:MAG: hypothetical protein A2115_03165 [Candidatus Woesebacteria bacterium GWA1_41_8]
MTEKWWQRFDPEAKSMFWPSLNEEAGIVSSLRKNWQILEGTGTGETIYQTPSGFFRAIEEEDGTLVRLERLENYNPPAV